MWGEPLIPPSNGDDSVHSFVIPINLEHLQAKETTIPNKDWTGLPVRGWHVVPEILVKPQFVRAGMHPESCSWPQIHWSKDYAKSGYAIQGMRREWKDKRPDARAFMKKWRLPNQHELHAQICNS